MVTLSTLKRIKNLAEKEVMTINGSMSYERVADLFILLGNAIADYEGENEDWLYIKNGYTSFDSIIVGAYWHFTEWHAGQSSNSYAALCSLGRVFNPGMEGLPEEGSSDYDFYSGLDQLASNN